jgi:hypothetical protein
MQGTTEFHHQIANTLLPQADPVFPDAAALHTAVDMLDPQPAVVQGINWLRVLQLVLTSYNI